MRAVLPDERVDRFTTPDGLGLRVATSGDPGRGPDDVTLFLAHGWSQDLRTWDRVLGDLRAAGVTTRVVRHDHRGHGGSDAAPAGGATIGRAADDLAALIADRAPTGRLVLAGHSMGGMTLMALAERHRSLVAERVAGLAFVATASDDMAELTLGLQGRTAAIAARGEHVLLPAVARLGHRAPVERTELPRGAVRVRARALAPLTRALVFGRHARWADVRSVAEQALAADPASVAAFRASIAEHRRTGALAAVRGTPAVVLVGGSDRLCPADHARTISGALPEAELVLFPGAGHMITFERSAEVAAHLRGLLDAASAPATTVEEATRAGA